MFKVPEKHRIKNGNFASTLLSGNNGAFMLTQKKNKPDLFIIASDGLGWEHVSISTSQRTPTWSEMCKVKDMFWDKEDCVVQYHPPESECINNHPYCLHIWRPIGTDIPKPPGLLIGNKDAGQLYNG